MIDFEKYFRMYCEENLISPTLSFDMPDGYETANGTFDPVVNTLFINKEMMHSQPEYEQMFYLFHELRHALQYLRPELFDEQIVKSRFYVIMYNGTCYRLMADDWAECKLEGTEEYFSDLYSGQPNERDANEFAYQSVKDLMGDSQELRDLYAFWMPKNDVSTRTYEEVYRKIDETIGEST